MFHSFEWIQGFETGDCSVVGPHNAGWLVTHECMVWVNDHKHVSFFFIAMHSHHCNVIANGRSFLPSQRSSLKWRPGPLPLTLARRTSIQRSRQGSLVWRLVFLVRADFSHQCVHWSFYLQAVCMSTNLKEFFFSAVNVLLVPVVLQTERAKLLVYSSSMRCIVFAAGGEMVIESLLWKKIGHTSCGLRVADKTLQRQFGLCFTVDLLNFTVYQPCCVLSESNKCKVVWPVE